MPISNSGIKVIICKMVKYNDDLNMNEYSMEAYGPVPSRRLGQSIGINHIPPKICTYSCVYCQLGRTINMQSNRQEFYPPDEVYKKVERQVHKAQEKDERIDYLTFVPDGEPTLDINLGKEIDMVKELGMKVAVISNASLISREDVREDLLNANWVSMKVDAVSESMWRKVNRPHGRLKHTAILQGIQEFSDIFDGELATETMLVRDLNDTPHEAEKIADFLSDVRPAESYVAIPTRPPAETWAKPPDERAINDVYQIFKEKLSHAEYLIGHEGNAFAFTGNFQEDMLNITSVHPMREEGVDSLLSKAGESWDAVHKLIEEEKIVEAEFQGNKFYIRALPSDCK
ncbi:MAG: radical SAM protein [Promethearchaeia archaeon]